MGTGLIPADGEVGQGFSQGRVCGVAGFWGAGGDARGFGGGAERGKAGRPLARPPPVAPPPDARPPKPRRVPAAPQVWRTRRRAVVPALHKRYVASMVGMFGDCALHGSGEFCPKHLNRGVCGRRVAPCGALGGCAPRLSGGAALIARAAGPSGRPGRGRPRGPGRAAREAPRPAPRPLPLAPTAAPRARARARPRSRAPQRASRRRRRRARPWRWRTGSAAWPSTSSARHALCYCHILCGVRGAFWGVSWARATARAGRVRVGFFPRSNRVLLRCGRSFGVRGGCGELVRPAGPRHHRQGALCLMRARVHARTHTHTHTRTHRHTDTQTQHTHRHTHTHTHARTMHNTQCTIHNAHMQHTDAQTHPPPTPRRCSTTTLTR
jgi:hypothetical protein